MTLLAKRQERSIVPRMYYITTAIDYTNGPPHIGHAYEKVLADVLARWHRMKGEEVYFLTGVDQHGQKVQQTAEKLGITPQEHVNNITGQFLALWDRLGISNDGWASTTDPRHKACVQKILTDLKDKGQLYKKSYKGFYSVRQEQFLTDKERDAEGNFGPEWGEVVELEEENWYFRLTDHVEWMKQFVEKSSDFVLPSFRKAEVLNAIDFDSDLCISRPKSRLSWGIEFPFDPEFVTYVWFDALINYISFAGYLAEPDSGLPDFAKLWPADCEVIGKDILVPAHGVYWPAMLHAMGFSDEEMPTLLVHGWWNINGEKMSKSIGNVIAPQELIDKYGAEIVRLWVSSVEYREDIRISEQILGRLVDAYRRIRNTCRFILGTINDLTRADLLPLDQLLPLDRYALHAAAQVHDRVQDAYMTYDFHKVYHTLHNYCVTDLSAVYLDILKDRLYSSAPASKERRSAQTALYHLLCMLVRDMAPVLSFTAEEIFHHLPNDLRDDVPTVFALPPVDSKPYLLEDGVRDDWNVLLAVRGAVTRAIEPLRRDSVVGHSLDTSVTLYVADELRDHLEGLHTDLRAFFIVSQLHLAPLADAPADAMQDAEVAGLAVGVAKAAGEKCERCWIYSTELGSDPAHPTLCPRCAKVMAELPEA